MGSVRKIITRADGGSVAFEFPGEGGRGPLQGVGNSPEAKSLSLQDGQTISFFNA
jgi:hypothetical protein